MRHQNYKFEVIVDAPPGKGLANSSAGAALTLDIALTFGAYLGDFLL
jgi:pantoate kinase